MLSEWQASKTNSQNLTGGCETGSGTASGTIAPKESLWEKKSEKKRRSLIRLGVEPQKAYAWSRSRMGGWAIAQSPILGTTITVERLKKRGYIPMLELYNQIRPSTAMFPMT